METVLTRPSIAYGALVDDAIVAAIVARSDRLCAILGRGGYFATAIAVAPERREDGNYARCDLYDFEAHWTVGYAPMGPRDGFRRHCGQLSGCLAYVLDAAGALPQLEG